MNIPITTSPNPERRLSALLASRLEHLESISSGLGDRYADVLTSRVSEHGGTVVHAAGGLVLVEFEDAAAAVNCAIDIQERLARYNKLHLDEGSLDASIGIHYGELYLSEGVCGGKGVDVAMTLLAIVPPAKIYITRDIFVRARLLLSLTFESIGKKTFASLPGEMEIFSVAWESVAKNLESSLQRLGDDDFQKSTTLSSKLGLNASRKASALVIILFVFFLIVLFKALKLL